MRNTYDGKNNLNKAGQNDSKQRQNYTSQNPKTTSFQKNLNPSTSQRMNKYIMQMLKKVTPGGNRTIAFTTIKPTQKTLINIISNLLASFDKVFDEQYLTVDMLIDLFRVLGYPYTINKTVFLPVGAPHTWGQCLQMMEWLAELASFHYDVRAHLDQGQFEQDFNLLLIRSYLSNQLDLPKQYLARLIQKNTKLIDNHIYNSKTNNLAIQNLKLVQKDLDILQEQQQRLRNILKREQQQLIQVDQQNQNLINKLNRVQRELFQKKNKCFKLDKQIQSLKREIQTQQLSVDQVNLIKIAIKQFRQKIIELKQTQFNDNEHYRKQCNKIMYEYSSFNKALQLITRLVSENQQQFQKRSVYFHIPDLNNEQFLAYLKNKSQETSLTKIQKFLGSKSVRQIIQKQKLLLEVGSMQIKNLQTSRQHLMKQYRDISDIVLEKQLSNQVESRNLDLIKKQFTQQSNKYHEAQRNLKFFLADLDSFDQKIDQTFQELKNKMKETQKLMKRTKQLTQIEEQYKQKIQETKKHIQMSQQDFQKTILEIMEEQQKEFTYLNQSVKDPTLTEIND